MTYKIVYETEVRHDGLGKYRHIKGSDRHVVEQKARAQISQWEAQWKKQCEARSRAVEKEERARQLAREKERRVSEKGRRAAAERAQVDAGERKAAERTEQAAALLAELRDTLSNTLSIDDAIEWESLKNNIPFPESPPKVELPQPPGDPRRGAPSRPVPTSLPEPPPPLETPPRPELPREPQPPNPEDARFQPVFSVLDRISDARRQKRIAEAKADYEWVYALWEKERNAVRQESLVRISRWQAEVKRLNALSAEQMEFWRADSARLLAEDAKRLAGWEKEVLRREAEYARAQAAWQATCTEIEVSHPGRLAEWDERRQAFLAHQAETNAAIDRQREAYLAGEPEAVIDYCEMVLANSRYPDCIPREWDIDYQADARTLLVEFALPAPADLPTLREVKYLPAKNEFKEAHLSDKEIAVLYDDLLYQIALRTLHELFEADRADALMAVVFNGLVTAIDKSTGNPATACVISVQASKANFESINLAQVDPKACFKSLKGVGSSKLHGMTAVPPIAVIDKADRRFVAAYGIVDGIDDSTNLAAMDWEDFEHLIREVFEKEFSTSGGEVKVTQASRDGGVDAVAFDPDPIRGGKIVIQAKRYTNTVGVSSVRDLYGTVMNEGATKGILVSTANFGPDAYEFAKGKPLALLNGGNLLHLLAKHGHRARIDLAEAKRG